jgi:hypothetical protein
MCGKAWKLGFFKKNVLGLMNFKKKWWEYCDNIGAL